MSPISLASTAESLLPAGATLLAIQRYSGGGWRARANTDYLIERKNNRNFEEK